MASSGGQHVLDISVGVQGDGDLVKLAEHLDGFSREAGETGPAFADMAKKLRELDGLQQIASDAAKLKLEAAGLGHQLDKATTDVDRLGAESEEAARAAAQLAQAYGTDAVAVKAAAQTAAHLSENYRKAQEKARELSAALGDKNRQLDAARAKLQAAGVQAGTLAQQQQALAQRSRETASAARLMEQEWLRVGAAATKTAAQQTSSHRKISAGVQSISTQLARLQALYMNIGGALAAVGGFRGLQQMTDEVKNLQARVKLAVGDAADMADVWKQVGDIAKVTNSSLSATGDLFARVTKAGRDAGKTGKQAVDEALQITTAVNQAAQLSGASAQASEAAVKQLVQALQSGVLRGDEFNSVMEQAPRLAQALADGLGVTTGKLREMAQSGNLSAEVVTNAIKSQAGVLKAEFGDMPKTVGRSLQNLATQFQLFLGDASEVNVTYSDVSFGM